MRVLRFRDEQAVYEFGTWDALTGPFPSLMAAEAWLEDPPAAIAPSFYSGQIEAVTVIRDRPTGSWQVLALRERRKEPA